MQMKAQCAFCRSPILSSREKVLIIDGDFTCTDCFDYYFQTDTRILEIAHKDLSYAHQLKYLSGTEYSLFVVAEVLEVNNETSS